MVVNKVIFSSDCLGRHSYSMSTVRPLHSYNYSTFILLFTSGTPLVHICNRVRGPLCYRLHATQSHSQVTQRAPFEGSKRYTYSSPCTGPLLWPPLSPMPRMWGATVVLITASPFPPFRLTFILLGYILVVRFSATHLRAHRPRYSLRLVIHVNDSLIPILECT